MLTAYSRVSICYSQKWPYMRLRKFDSSRTGITGKNISINQELRLLWTPNQKTPIIIIIKRIVIDLITTFISFMYNILSETISNFIIKIYITTKIFNCSSERLKRHWMTEIFPNRHFEVFFKSCLAFLTYRISNCRPFNFRFRSYDPDSDVFFNVISQAQCFGEIINIIIMQMKMQLHVYKNTTCAKSIPASSGSQFEGKAEIIIVITIIITGIVVTFLWFIYKDVPQQCTCSFFRQTYIYTISTL